jgi:hypothetical protein
MGTRPRVRRQIRGGDSDAVYAGDGVALMLVALVHDLPDVLLVQRPRHKAIGRRQELLGGRLLHLCTRRRNLSKLASATQAAV